MKNIFDTLKTGRYEKFTNGIFEILLNPIIERIKTDSFDGRIHLLVVRSDENEVLAYLHLQGEDPEGITNDLEIMPELLKADSFQSFIRLIIEKTFENGFKVNQISKEFLEEILNECPQMFLLGTQEPLKSNDNDDFKKSDWWK